MQMKTHYSYLLVYFLVCHQEPITVVVSIDGIDGIDGIDDIGGWND
jgi:hypothetical protein